MKSFSSSLTIRSLVIMAVAWCLDKFGVSESMDDQIGMVFDIIIQAIQPISIIIAAYGRARAQGPLVTKSSNDVNSHWAAGIFILVVCFMVAGCTGTRQLYKQAHTTEQRVKAVLIQHNAIGEEIIRLKEVGTLSDASMQKLLDGYRHTVCDREELDAHVPMADCDQGPAYIVERLGRIPSSIRDATTEEELQEAIDNLVIDVSGIIFTLQGALKEGK